MAFVDLMLAFAAWVGHAAIWLVALNVLYSRPYNKRLLKIAQLIDGLIVFSFPPVLLALWRFGATDNAVVKGYLALCLGMSLLAIPVATIARFVRRAAPQLVQRRGEVIDFAREIGRKPAGDFKHRWMATLPGNQCFQVEFVELTLKLPDLPAAWDGLTILQLTDLHLSGTPERAWYEAVLDRAMATGTPDIVAVTGDLVDTDAHHRWLIRLLRRVKWKEAGLAILGNHDVSRRPQRVRRRLERAGLTVLGNGWRELRVRGEPLIALGHEGPWFHPGPSLKGGPEGGFRLCLSHTPDNIRWARANRIGLMLCGHNHGGQIRLPLFGSLFVPSIYSRRYDCGLFWEAPTLMYVSRGLSGREPLRYNCRPEVTRLILKNA
jgi:predicted MPP superfamily phosphohydrolase